MKKVLYAINHKDTEAALTNRLQARGFITTGAVTYREAVIASLTESPADILVFRENLKGTMPVFDLMKKIRTEFPQTRVVFLGNARPATDKFLAHLVFLGIYDIISNDRPTLGDIEDFIANPRDFSFAAKYFQEQSMDELVPEPQVPVAPTVPQPAKKRGLFGFVGELIGGGEAPAEAAPAPATAPAQGPMQIITPASPSVDIDSMRGAMLEEARRTAQAEMTQILNTQVEAATATLKSDLQEQQETIATLSKGLKEKIEVEKSLQQQLEEAKQLRESLEAQLQKNQIDAEKALQAYQVQLTTLQATKPPEWYQEQTQKWLAEREYLKGKISEKEQLVAALEEKVRTVISERDSLITQLKAKEKELESMAMSMPRDITTAVDTALDVDFVNIPDDEADYQPAPAGDGRVILFMGTKHGVGNTTVALNTAIALANCKYKTLYIEINQHFPMVNEFFEFTNIVRGLDVAAKALQQNNTKLASQCIIKPHGVRTTKKSIEKVYKRLPGPLHFLLFSNDYLLKYKAGQAPRLTEREIKDLMYYLTMQEQYSYIIVDIQPDDQPTLDTFISSSYQANQLVLTLTQDPHSVTTAGYMITKLARSRNGNLIRGARFVVNQYAFSNKMSVGAISSFLRVPNSRISKISLDSKGYMDAAFSATPYLTAKGKYDKEYIDLRMALTG